MPDTLNAIKYRNTYNKENYDRMTVIMPKGRKDKIQDRAFELNKSVSAYINFLVEADLDGLAAAKETSHKKMPNPNALKCASFFAGVGGIDIGFETTKNRDFEVIYANEFDEYPARTYEDRKSVV